MSLPAPAPLASLGEVALFLDLDGTLAPIAPRPCDVGPDTARNALLARLRERMGGRIAVVSGRAIDDVDRILGRSVMAVAGLHGLERRSASGTLHRTSRHAGLDRARSAYQELAREHPGLLVEDKGASVALHYRGYPQAAAAALRRANEVAAATGLHLQEGAMVVELRTPGPDKGDAILEFLSEAPFAGAKPIFVGDDLTDEHGFAVVETLGGMGILVGPMRPTAARFRLVDTHAVWRWLGTSREPAACR
ncbi:MAG TPA: trehalose-phosphatase [Rhizomicrobium sp.]|nr:trehalose-phosphatase [Rhizomicrobium sp.]